MFAISARRVWAAALAAVALCAVALSGCSTYQNRSELIKQALLRQDYDAALENVEAIGKSSSGLLYYYEKGLVLHYQNRFAQSNEAFEQAENLFEDLYTKSVSREVAALVVKDDIAKYRGEPYEAVLVNYYKILNYLHLGDMEGALVECRRVNRKLQMIIDAGEEVYRNDPFVQYVTAMVYDAAGDDGDAEVSYRVAVAAYDTLAAEAGVVAPWTLYCDAERNAVRMGDMTAAESYGEGAGRECPPPGSNDGTVNLFIEAGYVAHKVEESVVLPIYSDDEWDDDDEFAGRLAKRRHAARRHNVKVSQVVKIAMPSLVADPSPYQYAVVCARADSTSAAAAAEARTVPAENVDVLARRAFQAREGKILLRTIVRALAKLAAQSKLGDKNEGLGVLMNVFNVATETADTRSWTTLPARIDMARLRLPAGTWILDVTLFGADGRPVDTFAIPAVTVDAGDSRFINYRVY